MQMLVLLLMLINCDSRCKNVYIPLYVQGDSPSDGNLWVLCTTGLLQPADLHVRGQESVPMLVHLKESLSMPARLKETVAKPGRLK